MNIVRYYIRIAIDTCRNSIIDLSSALTCFTIQRSLMTALTVTVLVWTGACSYFNTAGPDSNSSATTAATLTYPISIETVDGLSEMVSADKQLPVVYSETFVFDKDDKFDPNIAQDRASITISQKTPAGDESIVDVDVAIPPKQTVNILVTVKIDQDKMLRVKASVMETGLVKEYGPFPVQ